MDSGNEKKTGLRFDIEDGEPRDGGLVFDGGDDIAAQKPQKEEELSIPESFEINEKYNTPVVEEKPSIPVKRTYVPRFTSASENYRVTGNQPFESKPKRFEEPVSMEPKIDPTAEIDEAPDANPIVVVSTPDKPDDYVDESIKIYKFKGEEGFAKKSDADEVFESVRQDYSQAVEEKNEEIKEPESVVDEEISEIKEEAVIDYSAALCSVREVHEEIGPKTQSTEKAGAREFNVQSERDVIKDKFLDSIMAVKVRFFAAILLTLAILTFEALGYFGNFSFEYIGALHNGEAVIDLLCATAILALAIPELVRAVRYLTKRVISAELVLPVSYLFLLGYTLTVSIDNTTGINYMSFSVLFAMEALAAIASSYFRLLAEFRSFKIVSYNGVKYALDQRYTRTLERENFALDGAIDEYSSQIGRVYRTSFISDFRRHTSVAVENSTNVIVMLALSLGLGLASGIVALLISPSHAPRFLVGYEVFLTVFLLAVPVFTILLHKLPYKHALDEAAKEGSTFVGEGSFYEGSEVNVFAYRDTEIFGREDVTVRKVHLYGKVYNTPKAMREMYALFSATGGPLEEVFAAALDRKCPACSDVVIDDDGVMGIFEGHRVMAGTEEYMRRHSVVIPEDDYKTKNVAGDSIKTMYGAEDGEVYVKFLIRYSFSEEFSMLLPELKSRKIIPLVYSSDPNITCELLRVLTLGEDNMRVMRTYQPKEEEKIYRRVSSGAVSVNEKSGVLNLLLLSHRYVAFQSGFAVSELISMMVGALLAAVLSFAFIGDVSRIPGFALAVWQLAWCGVLYVRSKMTFRGKKG